MHLINITVNYLYKNMGFPFRILLEKGAEVQAILNDSNYFYRIYSEL